MMPAALHPTPRWRDVLAAQTRVVGFAMRRPALVAIAVLALATLLVMSEGQTDNGGIHFHPEHYVLPGLLGLLIPIGVWMGEERFGAGFLWTLPVDRRRHALAKVCAGWVWLMTAVAGLVLWLLALAVFSGGNVLADQTRQVLPSFSSGSGPFAPGAVQQVRWVAQPLFWLVPFTAATVTYLFASALALGTRHPPRWIVGAGFGFVLLVSLGEAANAERLMTAGGRLFGSLAYGPFGVDTLLTARTESLQVAATLTTGETVVVWRALPDPGQWAAATLLWAGAGLVALAAATSRHREGRRP